MVITYADEITKFAIIETMLDVIKAHLLSRSSNTIPTFGIMPGKELSFHFTGLTDEQKWRSICTTKDLKLEIEENRAF